MSYALVLDCNALRPHQEVTLPMSKLNPHNAIPPIIPKTLNAAHSKPTSASFTLPPAVVENFSSVDSGIGESNCILDPAKYMWKLGVICDHGDFFNCHQSDSEQFVTMVILNGFRWQKNSCADSNDLKNSSWAVVNYSISRKKME